MPGFSDISLTVSPFLFDVLLSSGKVTRMTEEKTTRELVYETNRDVKWICKTLQRMERCGEVSRPGFGRWRAGERNHRDLKPILPVCPGPRLNKVL